MIALRRTGGGGGYTSRLMRRIVPALSAMKTVGVLCVGSAHIASILLCSFIGSPLVFLDLADLRADSSRFELGGHREGRKVLALAFLGEVTWKK